MDKIEYVQICGKSFDKNFLDGFVRRQVVERCWRKEGGEYVLKPVSYIEDWTLAERRALAERIIKETENGSPAFAAVCGGKTVGFALIKKELFGSEKQYVDLAEFYVSEPFRRKGIGRGLFNLVCKAAKELGGSKLYISAHSAEESIAAYKSYGCVYATQINESLAKKEPCDLQLECGLDNRVPVRYN